MGSTLLNAFMFWSPFFFFIDILYIFGVTGDWLTTEGDARAAKRARLLIDEIDEDCEIEEDMQTIPKEESTFDDLCGDATFYNEERPNTETEMRSWGLLDGCVLARVFHFLRSDMKSLALVSLTCKHWRAVVSFYKDISRQIDLSSLGPNCIDSILLSIMVCFTFVLAF